ncbi:N-acetylmuramic acid 6-phosphate etherase [Brevibacillus sp. B_LB10_24]|uniref:N-acetylmuramic acid 6-phosphate etherase n=1 Tax=Brevibacillus sp. B_LB10_24 TaxID=3380645 RepID=UPI0038B6C9D9
MLALEHLATERRNQKTLQLDEMSLREILEVMNEEDQTVAVSVAKEIDSIEKVVADVIRSFQNGGRLIYIGAGTSGRLGVLDAVECPPTFGTDPQMVLGLIAGGEAAFVRAAEGAEDDEYLAAAELKQIHVSAADTVIGLAASGRTPYVISALKYAKQVGARAHGITCNKASELAKFADVCVEIETGPEVLTGSTRLKAGTAQKLVLNMISTASMIGIGKVYKNLMVDVKPTNQKLVERAKRIIAEAAGVDRETAEKYYHAANQNVKAAIVMILLNCGLAEAEAKLKDADGFVRKTLG